TENWPKVGCSRPYRNTKASISTLDRRPGEDLLVMGNMFGTQAFSDRPRTTLTGLLRACAKCYRRISPGHPGKPDAQLILLPKPAPLASLKGQRPHRLLERHSLAGYRHH